LQERAAIQGMPVFTRFRETEGTGKLKITVPELAGKSTDGSRLVFEPVGQTRRCSSRFTLPSCPVEIAVEKHAPDKEKSSYLGIPRRFAYVAVALVWWYLGSYVLLMEQRLEAFDPDTDRYNGKSHCRFVESVRTPGNISLYFPATCWANDFYGPVDGLFHSLRRAASLEYRDGKWKRARTQ